MQLSVIAEKISSLVWGNGTLLLILGTGIYLTIRLKFFQVRKFPKILQKTILSLFKPCKNPKDKASSTQLQAISAALAASMGTGNIVGVASALAIGGPGAIFWMWVSAIFGMATSYAENFLGLYYYNLQEKQKKSVLEIEKSTIKKKLEIGGAFLYFEYGLRSEKAAIFFALVCTFASFGIGNLTQANALANAAAYFSVTPTVCGVIFAVTIAIIAFMGSGVILRVTERILPFITVFYILGAVFLLITNIFALPNCLISIIKSAFGFEQAIGGFCGAIIKRSMTCGLQKGVFSNEAGMGSSVFAHTSAPCKDPVTMGCWGVFEVFLDTILCCTLTAAAILVTNSPIDAANPTQTVICAFESGLGRFAAPFVAFSIAVFAFATLLSWIYYGEKSVRRLFLSSEKSTKTALTVYRILYAAAIYIGCTALPDIAWTVADILNGIQCIPNLAAILLLSGKVTANISDDD